MTARTPDPAVPAPTPAQPPETPATNATRTRQQPPKKFNWWWVAAPVLAALAVLVVWLAFNGQPASNAAAPATSQTTSVITETVTLTKTVVISVTATPAATPTAKAKATTAPTVAPTPTAKATAKATVAPKATAAPTPTAIPTKAAPTATPDVSAIASAIYHGIPVPQGAPMAVEARVQEVSTHAAQELVNKGGSIADAPAMASALFDVMMAAGEFCWADKVATWSEDQSGDLQRLEISTSGVLHLDYYIPGNPSVSVIVHPGEVAVLAGVGSLWQFPSDRCVNYDYVADAGRYAAAREVWTHSGIVYASLTDWLKNAPPATNLRGVDPATVRPMLWEQQAVTLPAPAVGGSNAAAPTQQCVAQRIGDIETYQGSPNQTWTAEVWENDGVAISMLLVGAAGQPLPNAKGALWSWCDLSVDQVMAAELAAGKTPVRLQ